MASIVTIDDYKIKRGFVGFESCYEPVPMRTWLVDGAFLIRRAFIKRRSAALLSYVPKFWVTAPTESEKRFWNFYGKWDRCTKEVHLFRNGRIYKDKYALCRFVKSDGEHIFCSADYLKFILKTLALKASEIRVWSWENNSYKPLFITNPKGFLIAVLMPVAVADQSQVKRYVA